MNILTSYNWLKEYLDTKLSAKEFAELTTNAGNSVEYIYDLKERFANMVVGEVAKLKEHPQADRLQVVETKIGRKTVEIVCGGVNLREGMKVAVALPGSKVIWHGQGDWVELHETKVRGVKSHGMIAAAEELGFAKLAQGENDIWDISELTKAKPGTALSEALELDDILFDIEVTTNRPDCMSIIGQAREGSAVTRDKFKTPTPPKPPTPPKSLVPLKVSIKATDLCDKYEAIVIDGVTVGPSPWWLQKHLLLSGHRPINNVVDVTNYVLHEYGQPLHAFDASKIEGDEIQVRQAKKGEKIAALDDNEYKLTDKMLVIADSKKPVAVAGVMGGFETGTTDLTTRIVLEAATFDPVSVRQTSRALNLYSDSSSLFEKGLSTESTGPALARAVELILELCGGQVVTDVVADQQKIYEPKHFNFDPERISSLMGVEVSEKEMKGILERLGFEVTKGQVFVPYWRAQDIENEVDFVEEIARVYGYDKIPSVLPVGEIPRTAPDPVLLWERRFKEVLRGAGLTETYSYSFASDKELERYSIPLDQAVKLENPLSSDQEYMRPSLVPTMLSTIEANQCRYPEAALFELAPIYLPSSKDIPLHQTMLLIAVYEKDGYQAFRKAKGILDRLASEFCLTDLELERLENDQRFHPGRTAQIKIKDQVLGKIGEVSREFASAFDLDVRTTIIELDFEALVLHCKTLKSYTPIPIYPEVKRDLAFVVPEPVEFDQIEVAMKKTSALLRQVELFDIYRGKGVEEGKKSLATHLSFRLHDRTLEAKEVEQELEQLRKMLQKDFNAIMRS
ncbi:phenylalanine--tRNA ligase subunit beta [Patescibacteria group bacterium]